jgi:ectoine hydroxylase
VELNDDLIARYACDGYLFFTCLMSAAELVPLRVGLARLAARRGPETVLEPHRPGAVKMVFGVDEHEEAYRRLRAHPCLLAPAERLLGARAYVYQSRVNFNSGFAGGGWGWHQDFNQWYRQDGLRRPDAVLAGVFLDDVTACNAPLMVIPGSHRGGHIYVPDRMEIDEELVAERASAGGIQPLIGPAGSVALLHPLTVHGSSPNITPWPRTICYFIYNSVENTDMTHPRGGSRCRTDFTPVTALDGRCLLDIADGGAIPETTKR